MSCKDEEAEKSMSAANSFDFSMVNMKRERHESEDTIIYTPELCNTDVKSETDEDTNFTDEPKMKKEDTNNVVVKIELQDKCGIVYPAVVCTMADTVSTLTTTSHNAIRATNKQEVLLTTIPSGILAGQTITAQPIGQALTTHRKIMPKTGKQKNNQPVQASGKAVTGQPIAGQPLIGQPIAGQPKPSQTITGEPLTSQSIAGQPLSIQQTIGNPLTGQPIAGQPLIGQPIVGQPLTGQPTIGQPLIGQPITGQPLTGQPTIGQPLIGQPIAGQPLTGQPTIGQPLTGQPTTGQSLTGLTIAGQPLTSQSIAGQPLTIQQTQPLTSQAISGQPLTGLTIAGQQLTGQSIAGQAPIMIDAQGNIISRAALPMGSQGYILPSLNQPPITRTTKELTQFPQIPGIILLNSQRGMTQQSGNIMSTVQPQIQTALPKTPIVQTSGTVVTPTSSASRMPFTVVENINSSMALQEPGVTQSNKPSTVCSTTAELNLQKPQGKEKNIQSETKRTQTVLQRLKSKQGLNSDKNKTVVSKNQDLLPSENVASSSQAQSIGGNTVSTPQPVVKPAQNHTRYVLFQRPDGSLIALPTLPPLPGQGMAAGFAGGTPALQMVPGVNSLAESAVLPVQPFIPQAQLNQLSAPPMVPPIRSVQTGKQGQPAGFILTKPGNVIGSNVKNAGQSVTQQKVLSSDVGKFNSFHNSSSIPASSPTASEVGQSSQSLGTSPQNAILQKDVPDTSKSISNIPVTVKLAEQMTESAGKRKNKLRPLVSGRKTRLIAPKPSILPLAQLPSVLPQNAPLTNDLQGVDSNTSHGSPTQHKDPEATNDSNEPTSMTGPNEKQDDIANKTVTVSQHLPVPMVNANQTATNPLTVNSGAGNVLPQQQYRFVNQNNPSGFLPFQNIQPVLPANFNQSLSGMVGSANQTVPIVSVGSSTTQNIQGVTMANTSQNLTSGTMSAANQNFPMGSIVNTNQQFSMAALSNVSQSIPVVSWGNINTLPMVSLASTIQALPHVSTANTNHGFPGTVMNNTRQSLPIVASQAHSATLVIPSESPKQTLTQHQVDSSSTPDSHTKEKMNSKKSDSPKKSNSSKKPNSSKKTPCSGFIYQSPLIAKTKPRSFGCEICPFTTFDKMKVYDHLEEIHDIHSFEVKARHITAK